MESFFSVPSPPYPPKLLHTDWWKRGYREEGKKVHWKSDQIWQLYSVPVYHLSVTGGSFKTVTLSWPRANSTTSVWSRISNWWSLLRAYKKCDAEWTPACTAKWCWMRLRLKACSASSANAKNSTLTFVADFSLLNVAKAACFCGDGQICSHWTEKTNAKMFKFTRLSQVQRTRRPRFEKTLTDSAPKYFKRSSFSFWLSSAGKWWTSNVLLELDWTTSSFLSICFSCGPVSKETKTLKHKVSRINQ